MNFILISLAYLIISGIISFYLSNRNGRLANYIGASGALISLLFSLAPSLGSVFGFHINSISFNWSIPFGTINAGLDALSGFFLISVLILCAAGSVYGIKYMEKAFSSSGKHASWLWYNLLEAGMMAVLISQNSVLFIVAWELMSISSFFLVIHEHKKESSRNAAWIYMTATHIGTFFILVLFIIMSVNAGSFDLSENVKMTSMASSIVFVFAIIGFGSKAGFVPFHVWLPEAHPVAPSHVSAVMSGVMIKMGIYGVLRVITLQTHVLVWWGLLLIIIGVLSGFWGVILALTQNNLKRLLAYSSVENVGIITIGIGLGVLGLSLSLPSVAILGFSGGILHVLNHCFFKGLLFLSAGSVLHETGTLDIDRLGGLSKKMPFTSFGFIVGSASISGLPPFNGFISEFLIYLGALNLLFPFVPINTTAAVVIIVMVPLIGGLALACFAKASGIVFLGEIRNGNLDSIHESPALMVSSMIFLAAGCVVIPYLCPLIMKGLGCVISVFPHMQTYLRLYNVGEYSNLLLNISFVFLGLTVLGCLIWFFRFMLLRGKVVKYSPTWDCGYCKPSPRMQYTGSSFADPIVKFFHLFIQTVSTIKLPGRKIFPKTTFVESESPDPFTRFFYSKLFVSIKVFFTKLKWIQNGNLQLYILYLTVTLIILIVWELI